MTSLRRIRLPRFNCSIQVTRFAQEAAVLIMVLTLPVQVHAQTAKQPKVAPGPNEPDWVKLLDEEYGLDPVADLANPVETDPRDVPGLFIKAGKGPVVYRPLIALGLETPTHGGYYSPHPDPTRTQIKIWSYQFKNTAHDLKTRMNLPPPLMEGSKVEFDPGDQPFGVWVSNAGFADEPGVFSEPRAVEAANPRLAHQPYKVMIYPYRDKTTGKFVPNAYLLGWEYSTNDDFQDVVCVLENVRLVKPQRNSSP